MIDIIDLKKSYQQSQYELQDTKRALEMSDTERDRMASEWKSVSEAKKESDNERISLEREVARCMSKIELANLELRGKEEVFRMCCL